LFEAILKAVLAVQSSKTNMSKATKRKHVTKEVMDDYVVPDENQEIVKVSVLCSVGKSSRLTLLIAEL